MGEFRDRPDEPEENQRPPDRPGEGDDPPRRDPNERWDPVVAGDTRISQFELPRERCWLDSPDRPPPLGDTRPYDEPGGLAEPEPRDQ